MFRYSTKSELLAAYQAVRPTLHKQCISVAAKYVPHIYRGGYVIRGFGYSTERIGTFISEQDAGDPLLACCGPN